MDDEEYAYAVSSEDWFVMFYIICSMYLVVVSDSVYDGQAFHPQDVKNFKIAQLYIYM